VDAEALVDTEKRSIRGPHWRWSSSSPWVWLAVKGANVQGHDQPALVAA